MKKISFLLICILFTRCLIAQEIGVQYANKAPLIDGYVDENENEWGSIPVRITKQFGDELPTVTSEWFSLFDTDNFYLAIIVNDDNIWIGDEAGGADSLFDHFEVFFDVNTEDLKDGMGPVDAGSGHYRFVGSLKEENDGITITESPEGQNPGGTYVYNQGIKEYMYEIAFPWANFKNKAGISLDKLLIDMGGLSMGFDVVIFDQDEGVTTTPQRMAWVNNDLSKPDWVNMDGAGKIRFPWMDYDYWGPMLYLSSYSLTLSANAGSTDSITIDMGNTYSYAWTAVSDKSWLVVNPTAYNGNGTLRVTASENTGVARSATVVFDWVGNRGAELIVNQEAGGVGFTSRKTQNVKISPNPATDLVSIQGGVDRIELFNSLGIKVRETKIRGRTFSVGDLPYGVYILKAFKEENLAGVTKIVKN
jgi:hypothetical protein